jgi:hypothetical protein
LMLPSWAVAAVVITRISTRGDRLRVTNPNMLLSLISVIYKI